MAANGISTLNAGSPNAKQQRQLKKLVIAEAKRQGKTVAINGTITGALDVTKPYYRVNCYSKIGRLPTRYHANGSLVDHANAGGLKTSRPWSPTA